MIKTLACIKRLDSTTRAAFRDHYENVHVPLALPILEGLRQYVRYHVVKQRVGDFDFDVLTAFGYPDKPAADRVFARLGSQEGSAILEDERCFMEPAANRFSAVTERLWETRAGEAGEEGRSSVFVLVARPERLSRYDACAQLTIEYWPQLIDTVGGVRYALLRDAFPVEAGDSNLSRLHDLPFDAVMQLSSGDVSGLGDWAKQLERLGFRVCAVETERHETLIGV